jgi:hypothetical protein
MGEWGWPVTRTESGQWRFGGGAFVDGSTDSVGAVLDMSKDRERGATGVLYGLEYLSRGRLGHEMSFPDLAQHRRFILLERLVAQLGAASFAERRSRVGVVRASRVEEK